MSGPDCSGPRVWLGQRSVRAHELTDRARAVAAGLLKMGVGEADTVALILRNDFAFLEASIGAGFAGAYAVPINWHSTADEAGYVLRDCAAKAVILHEDLLTGIEQGLPVNLPVLVCPTPVELREAYQLSGSTRTSVPALDWETWLAGQSPLTPRDQTAKRSAIFYTSGTTGRPKGVRRGEGPAPTAATTALDVFGFSVAGPITALINGPMYHTAPNVYCSVAMACGADIVLQPRFDAEQMLALIESRGVTHVHVVPTMFVRLLRLPARLRAKYDLSSLRFVVHGGAPCPPHVKRAMIDWWGPIIHEYYGSTETGIVAALTASEALRRPGAVGRIVPSAEVKIIGAGGRELPAGEIGEIHVRATDQACFTYIGDEARSAARSDFVSVGDVGCLDEEGYLFLADRKRDMIISGGVNIYPAEIEAALLLLPGVRDCAVFGIPDDEFGEAVCAHVEIVEGASLTAEGIRTQLVGRLSRFKVPKTIEFSAGLPREDSGKIFKRRLKDPYWSR